MSRPVVDFRPTLLAALLLLPALAFGLSSDREQPMDVDAEHMDGELTANGAIELRGNVLIRQGTLRIDADRANVQRRAGEIARIEFNGAPARMEQTLDAGGSARAQAGHIDYDPKARVVVLTGDVVVTQPEGSMRGERITYNLQTGNLSGGETGSRIRMRIEPRQPAAD
jgi:lipopolysaccharide export system protein LptA